MKVPRDAFGLHPQAFPRDFHKPPRFTGDLITIFLKTMVLLINICTFENRAHGRNLACAIQNLVGPAPLFYKAP